MPSSPATGATPGPAAGDHLPSPAAAYRAQRAALLARDVPGRQRRARLAEVTDAWLADLVARADPGPGVALAAVGGLGRRDLAPRGDLDLVLLHEPDVDVAPVAEALWYPVWDSGVRLDHAVRTPDQTREIAAADVPALLGLLDLRHVAGDAALTARTRGAVLADFRASAFRRLPVVLGHAHERTRRAGELPSLVEPDVKEARGGLRDLAVLHAVGASWLADVPWFRLDEPRRVLLDVRDALHVVTGRACQRLLHQEQDEVAGLLGYPAADALLRDVSAAGRAVCHVVDVTGRQVRRALAARDRHREGRAGRPSPWRPLGRGVLERDGEVALDPRADPAEDPLLAVRAAAAAARLGLPLAPRSVDRLAGGPGPGEPWDARARDALLALLGSGPGLVPVWEALDQAGVVSALLPEWEAVRSLPQRNPVHRHTVDRHCVEAVVGAAALSTRVDRPDLLLLAALCHDLGKGAALHGGGPRPDPGEGHAAAGVAPARTVAVRLGLDEEDTEVLATLVRHHLLLATVATRRDPADPRTVETVREAVGTPEVLDLLHALTEADARAAGPGAWTAWRAACVGDLVSRVHAAFRGVRPPGPPGPPEPEPALRARAEEGDLHAAVRPGPHGLTVVVVAPDRPGLLATVAGLLALHGLSVRTAATRTYGPGAVMHWEVDDTPGPSTPARLSARLEEDLTLALQGRLDPADRLAELPARPGTAGGGTPSAPPRVDVLPEASGAATVLEVRGRDAPVLLHRVAGLLRDEGVDVTAARVATFGDAVVDVFFVVGPGGDPLAPARAAEVADRVAAALGAP